MNDFKKFDLMQHTPTITGTGTNDEVIKETFVSILKLQSIQKIDTALDVIYESVQNFLLDGKFDLVDEMLVDGKIKELVPDLQLGLLVVTRPFKGKLSRRVDFFKVVHTNFVLSKSQERADRILNSLL